MAFKVYVTDYDYGTLDPEKNEVAKIGAVLVPTQSKTEDAIIENCKDADGLLNQYAPITRKVMESLPNLKSSAAMASASILSILRLRRTWGFRLSMYRIFVWMKCRIRRLL